MGDASGECGVKLDILFNETKSPLFVDFGTNNKGKSLAELNSRTFLLTAPYFMNYNHDSISILYYLMLSLI